MKITAKISKVLEINNCNDSDLLKALYVAEFWEEINPTKRMEAKFTAPNVLHTKIYDEVDLLKIPIEMDGELVLSDKGQDPGKGHLIEFNVRNNKDIQELEGRMRIKSVSPNKSKVGVFVETFTLSSDVLRSIAGVGDLVLQNKISEMLRNIEKYCKTKDLKAFL